MRYVAVLALLVFSGCLSEADGDVASPEAEPTPAGYSVTPPEPMEWDIVVDWRGGSLEFDILCTAGGGFSPSREGPLITANATELFVDLSVPPTMTGYQIGYAIDGGEITWLDMVAGGDQKNMTVPLSNDLVEVRDFRWSFHARASVPVAEPDCYTGGGQGPPEARITVHNA
jgi:hypothetical protein